MSEYVLNVLDQRPMRFANPWPEHVRRKHEKDVLKKQIRSDLKKQVSLGCGGEMFRAGGDDSAPVAFPPY